MSPTSTPARLARPCFPRVSGDEPMELSDGARHVVFSPRERG